MKQDKPFLRPRQYHTDAELDQIRRDGICCKCKGKYYKGHPCTSAELQIMIVTNGFKMEVMEENTVELLEAVADSEHGPSTECMALSSNAFMEAHR